MGWFASLVPVTVPIGGGSFPEAARAAQNSFDDAKHLAGVPFERVLELTTPDQLGIELRARSELMVSFIDLRKIPVAALFEETNFGTYGDNLSHGGINIWINRHADKTTVTISFPDNPVARESVHRYIAALHEAFARAVKTTSDWVDAVADHANSRPRHARHQPANDKDGQENEQCTRSRRPDLLSHRAGGRSHQRDSVRLGV